MTPRDSLSAATFAPPRPNRRHRRLRHLSPVALLVALAGVPSATLAQTQQTAAAEAEYYVVRKGDTLGTIAKRFGLNYRELAKWNDIVDASRIELGQRIRLSPPAGDRRAPAPRNVESAQGNAALAPRKTVPAQVKSVPEPAATRPAPRTAAATATQPPGAQTEPIGTQAQGAARPAPVGRPASTADQPTPAVSTPTNAPAVNTVAVPKPGKVVEETAADASAASRQREELETLRQTQLNLIKLLVDSGVLTQEKASELMQQAKRTAAETVTTEKTAQTKVVRVPYVPQIVRDQIKEEIREEVINEAKAERWGAPGTLPEWTQRITLSGDLRLRYQGEYFSQDNAPAVDINATNAGDGLVLRNTTQDQDLWRYQARIGLQARILDSLKAGFRITTGNTGNPVSFNQTLGDTFNKSSIVLDLAYLEGTPTDWLTLWGGRFTNPFFKTNLVWDEDLGFDGIAGKFHKRFGDSNEAYLTLGAFPIQFLGCDTAVDIGTCGNNKWLYGGQVGFNREFAWGSKLRLGLAYYDFRNISGEFNSPTVNPDNRSSLLNYNQGGNTYFNIVTNGGNPLLGLAPEYAEVNLTGQLEITRFDPVHLTLTGDYVQNVGYNQSQIYQRTAGLVDASARTQGYMLGLTVGSPRFNAFGDWQVVGAYKYLQGDAVVDAFTDSDFHLGGTNARGYVLSAAYGLGKNVWVRARWLSANSIDGPPLDIDVLQVDLQAGF